MVGRKPRIPSRPPPGTPHDRPSPSEADLPPRDRGADVRELRRRALAMDVLELERHLGVADLKRRDLSDRELGGMEDRLDRAMAPLFGVTRRDRVLLVLARATVQAASGLQEASHSTELGRRLRTIELVEYWKFCATRFPKYFSNTTPKMMAEFVHAYELLLRKGPRLKKARHLPIKWIAFHALAVTLGLITSRMDPESLQRTVRRAQRKFRPPPPPPP